MGEEFKTKLESFIQNLVIKIGDKTTLDVIQKEYEELIDNCIYQQIIFIYIIDSLLTVLTKEEFESFDLEFAEYDKKIELLTKENTELKSSLKSQLDINEQKILLLTKELDSNALIKKDLANSNQLSASLQNKLKGYQNESMDLNLKVQSLTTLASDLKAENKKLSNENFEKFEKLNSFQKDIKLKSNTIDQIRNEMKQITKSKEDTENKLKEIEKNASISKMYYENQLNNLKKHIDEMTKENNDYKKDIVNLQNQVREFQNYTNMAKVNVDHLEKKEFSILEVMSKRVQICEGENEAFKRVNNDLKKENEELNKKIGPLERLVLHYMKKDNENEEGKGIISIYDISDKEMKEIESYRNRSNKLFDMCIKLKNENWLLQNEIEQITIECNQRLRSFNMSNSK